MSALVGALLGAGVFLVWWSCWTRPTGTRTRHAGAGKFRTVLLQAGLPGVAPATFAALSLALAGVAGLLTFASAAGALLMKFVATPIVRHFGFRRVLTVNAVLAGAFVAASAAFTPTTPVWLMIAVLLVGGFFRSLQFTGVNTLTYADIPPAKMSRASSFAAMAQQLGISLGVGVAAVTLNVSMTLRGAETLAIRDVVAGFIVIGLMCAASVFSFRRLEPLAGAHLNGAKQSDDE